MFTSFLPLRRLASHVLLLLVFVRWAVCLSPLPAAAQTFRVGNGSPSTVSAPNLSLAEFLSLFPTTVPISGYGEEIVAPIYPDQVSLDEGRLVSRAMRRFVGDTMYVAYLYQLQPNTVDVAVTSVQEWAGPFLPFTGFSVGVPSADQGGGYFYEITSLGGASPLGSFLLPGVETPGLLEEAENVTGTSGSGFSVEFIDGTAQGGPGPKVDPGERSPIYVTFGSGDAVIIPAPHPAPSMDTRYQPGVLCPPSTATGSSPEPSGWVSLLIGLGGAVGVSFRHFRKRPALRSRR